MRRPPCCLLVWCTLGGLPTPPSCCSALPVTAAFAASSLVTPTATATAVEEEPPPEPNRPPAAGASAAPAAAGATTTSAADAGCCCCCCWLVLLLLLLGVLRRLLCDEAVQRPQRLHLQRLRQVRVHHPGRLAAPHLRPDVAAVVGSVRGEVVSISSAKSRDQPSEAESQEEKDDAAGSQAASARRCVHVCFRGAPPRRSRTRAGTARRWGRQPRSRRRGRLFSSISRMRRAAAWPSQTGLSEQVEEAAQASAADRARSAPSAHARSVTHAGRTSTWGPKTTDRSTRPKKKSPPSLGETPTTRQQQRHSPCSTHMLLLLDVRHDEVERRDSREERLDALRPVLRRHAPSPGCVGSGGVMSAAA